MKTILRPILATLLLAWAVARGEAADVIGQHWGNATEKAQYRTWASYDGWSTDMQADNYPFKPAEASQVNHNRTLQDLLIRAPAGSAHDIAIRASTAYAGAISSVQYQSQELIHATIGAAFQFHLRYWNGDLVKGKYVFNECENPTEAGNSRDMQNLPKQGPSSSYIDFFQVQQDQNGYPRIVTRNAPVDFTPPGSTSDSDYGSGRCTNQRTEWFTGYYINKWVTLGWKSPLTEQEFDNVIQIDARVDIPVAHQDMRALQVELIAYFRRWAYQQATYSTTDGGRFNFDGNGFAKGGGEQGNARRVLQHRQDFRRRDFCRSTTGRRHNRSRRQARRRVALHAKSIMNSPRFTRKSSKHA